MNIKAGEIGVDILKYEIKNKQLVGTRKEAIYQSFCTLLKNREEYDKMSTACNPYEDGFAVKRIVDIRMHP